MSVEQTRLFPGNVSGTKSPPSVQPVLAPPVAVCVTVSDGRLQVPGEFVERPSGNFGKGQSLCHNVYTATNLLAV